MVSHSESSLNAISRMSPPHVGHASGNSSPTRAISFAQAFARRVVRAGLLMRVRAASRGATFVPMPAGSGLALLADVAFLRAP
jgi:anaerobic glycerol-3-phosphate dehydrogenase